MYNMGTVRGSMSAGAFLAIQNEDTPINTKRARMYLVEGLTHSQIAEQEQRCISAVRRSIVHFMRCTGERGRRKYKPRLKYHRVIFDPRINYPYTGVRPFGY